MNIIRHFKNTTNILQTPQQLRLLLLECFFICYLNIGTMLAGR